jgi:hypothetical protein
MPRKVRRAGAERLGYLIRRAWPVDRERGVDMRRVNVGRQFLVPVGPLPAKDGFPMREVLWQVVSPQAEPGLVELSVAQKERLKINRRVRRAARVREDVRIADPAFSRGFGG